METNNQNNSPQDLNHSNASSDANEDKALASDGPVSKAEGTESVDLDENETSKGFDRDQEELNYGFREGDLDTDETDEREKNK